MSHQISVVITCYREGILLKEAVESVLGQSIKPLEIIIVNDASPDEDTNQVCRKMAEYPEIKVIWQDQNSGPSVSRNAGFSAAIGHILVPLDADDLLPSDALKHIRDAFDQHPDAGFIYGSYIRQDNPRKNKLVPAKPITLNSLLKSKRFSLSSNWTLIGTAPIQKKLWEEIGHGDSNMGIEDLHDVDFWIRAMALPCNFYATQEIIYIWRKYLGSNSRQVNPMSWHRIAHKHLDVYLHNDVDYRAYELLLLGSKWMGDRDAARKYQDELWNCIKKGRFQLSTFMAILMPTFLFQPLAKIFGKAR